MKNLITVLLVVISSFATAQTGMDSLMLEEINKARTNPKSYIPLIKEYITTKEKMLTRIKSGKTKVVSTSGNMTKKNGISRGKSITGTDVIKRDIKAAKELINVFNTMKPVRELMFCQTIDSVSDSHGQYLDSLGVRGHFGPNGQTVKDRFDSLNISSVTENVSSVGTFVYVKKNVNPIIIGLLVDGGVKNRGHRNNLLNPKAKFIGIYMSKKTCVQNFCY